MTAEPARDKKDWVGEPRSYALAWGLPSAALLSGIFVEPGLRTGIWTLSLVWMGLACSANAARCGRRHCFLTGPFFLVMAAAVLLHGTGVFWLGQRGWWWLGLTLVVGGYGGLWLLPEKLWGKYTRSGQAGAPPKP